MLVIVVIVVLLVFGLTSPAGQQPAASPDASSQPISSVPLFARLASTSNAVHTYAAPLTIDVSMHRFFLTLHRHLAGNVRYEAPDHVTFTIERVPDQYQHLFTELGTPMTWQSIYALQIENRTVLNGVTTYTLRGVPRQPCDVDHIEIQTSDDPNAPIHAQWFLHDDWTVTSTIEEETTNNNFIVPKHELADIVGHGYNIHSDMTFGDYAMNAE